MNITCKNVQGSSATLNNFFHTHTLLVRERKGISEFEILCALFLSDCQKANQQFQLINQTCPLHVPPSPQVLAFKLNAPAMSQPSLPTQIQCVKHLSGTPQWLLL